MFDLLLKMTQRGERVTVTYERKDDDTIQLLVQPVLTDNGSSDHDSNSEADKARAALQRPLAIKGAHADVVAQFETYVNETRDSRADLADKVKAAIQDATKAASQESDQSSKSKGGSQSGASQKSDATTDTGASQKTQSAADLFNAD